MIQETTHHFLTRRKSITVVSVIAYIIFSLVKRTGSTPGLYWLPLIIVIVNLPLLTRNAVAFYRYKEVQTRSNTVWLISQFIFNLVFAILIATYV